ncbi:MAG: manganese efflux pump, partial [Sciscionella sp.]|nr:manganese efflux pump [Sciscionella sp.]
MPVLKLLAFVLPLGLDSFAVAAAIGAAGPLAASTRWRITALFVVFEAGMPLLGLALGAPLARLIGPAANYVAAVAVIGIGAWMLFTGESDDEDDNAGRLLTAHGMALIGLGISISLDELAIGFSLGLTHLPLLAVITAIGGQALLAAQFGLLLGARIAERFREWAERLAGIVLIALGLFLL